MKVRSLESGVWSLRSKTKRERGSVLTSDSGLQTPDSRLQTMQTEQIIETAEAAERPSAPDRSAPSPSALAASDLVKAYGRRRVVDGVSLHMEPGEVVGLLGANGAGKTTTFYMIIGLERAQAGRITPAARDITRLPRYLRARLGIGHLPQEPSGFRRMPAAANIL